MGFSDTFKEELFKINESNFNIKALSVFNYQYLHNPIYRKYVDALGKSPISVQHYSEIPFLPITFYQSEKVISGTKEISKVFYSSGTTSKDLRSKHYLVSTAWYEKIFTKIWENQYGPIENTILLALVPSYQENPDSSLLYMLEVLIKKTNSMYSGFISTNFEEMLSQLPLIRSSGKKIILIGVAYALLELAEKFSPNLSDFTIIETGGMKGRRAELLKVELHEILKKYFQVTQISSEYGMTELLSQAYALQNGRFKTPPWMKMLIRKVNDPFAISEKERGGINIIDLANIDSCAFIETQDLGIIHEDGQLEILGRMDNAEQRGCNLLYG